MYEAQLIRAPYGISVFGSAIVEVDPDAVSIYCAVARLQQHPKEAFRDARKASQDVRRYLDAAQVNAIRTSRVTVEQSFRFVAGERKFAGYTARVAFHVTLQHLDTLEDILSGIVDAGVNEISKVEFQTSRLKEVRADARRQAIGAAREKAENYCSAAGVRLGKVIHIQDINPDLLRGSEGHRARSEPTDGIGAAQAFDPGNIAIGAAVAVAFEIDHQAA